MPDRRKVKVITPKIIFDPNLRLEGNYVLPVDKDEILEILRKANFDMGDETLDHYMLYGYNGKSRFNDIITVTKGPIISYRKRAGSEDDRLRSAAGLYMNNNDLIRYDVVPPYTVITSPRLFTRVKEVYEGLGARIERIQKSA